MSERDGSDLDRLVERVASGAKYRMVCEALIRETGKRALSSHPRLQDAEKAVKSKLHQVAASFFTGKPDYGRWLEELQSATGDAERIRAACRRVMESHASTRERLPFLDEFYAKAFSRLPLIRSVMDLGCGLNPLAIPWMPLVPAPVYNAYDVYTDLMSFLSDCFPLLGVNGKAKPLDLSRTLPEQEADVALVLKLLPTLEQLQKGAAPRLLRGLRVRYLLVSFPRKSRGGCDKGMTENYERLLTEWIQGETWEVERCVFPTELLFLIRKG